MAKPRILRAICVSSSRIIRLFLFTVIALFAGFALSIFSTSSANAAPTTVTGIISGMPDDAYGIAWAEKYISGEWVDINGSYTKDIYKDQTYSINLGEATGSSVRIWAQFGNVGTSYLTGGDSFTVSTTSISRNISLSPLNYKFTVSNTKVIFEG